MFKYLCWFPAVGWKIFPTPSEHSDCGELTTLRKHHNHLLPLFLPSVSPLPGISFLLHWDGTQASGSRAPPLVTGWSARVILLRGLALWSGEVPLRPSTPGPSGLAGAPLLFSRGSSTPLTLRPVWLTGRELTFLEPGWGAGGGNAHNSACAGPTESNAPRLVWLLPSSLLVSIAVSWFKAQQAKKGPQ